MSSYQLFELQNKLSTAPPPNMQEA